MRLLDRILANGITTGDIPFNDETLIDNLKKAQLVVIDNVATYVYQMAMSAFQSGDSKADVKAADFPNVMLPFEVAFLEMRPRFHDGTFFPGLYDEAGLLMKMYRAQEFRGYLGRNFTNNQSWQTGNAFTHPDAVWFLTARLLLHERSARQVLHWGNFTLAVDADGRILESERGWVDMVIMGGKDLDRQEEIGGCFASLCLPPALLALSFMHCRNVKVRTEVPPAPLSKKHERKTGRPLLKYRLLQIDHMKEALEREGGASTGGLKKALHICRGHFKHYGRDGKGLLFGKYEATVWIPMHSRGSSEEGVVVKDYEVK